MNQKLYQQAFDKVTLSQKTQVSILEKLNKTKKPFSMKRVVVAVCIIAVLSTTTVFATEYFNLGEHLNALFNKIYQIKTTDQVYFEQYGTSLNVAVGDGVLTALVGDEEYIYISYTGDVGMPTFLGDNPFSPSILEKGTIPCDVAKMGYSDQSGVFILTPNLKNAGNITLLMQDDSYLDTGVSLNEFADETKLANTLTDITLTQVDFADNGLTIQFTSNQWSNYAGYNLCLKDRETGEIISRRNGESYDINNKIYLYEYAVSHTNYNLVVQKETLLTLPPVSEQESMVLDLDITAELSTIKKISISPLSVRIDGLGTPIPPSQVSLLLKDGTVISNTEHSSMRSSKSEFVITFPLTHPMLLDDMEAILITQNNDTIRIPIS